MNYSFTNGADHDITQALDFYTTRASVLVAERFAAELARVVQLLRVYPRFGTGISAERRTYPLNGFPYSVVYKVSGEHLRILVVRHQSRKFEHGHGRH